MSSEKLEMSESQSVEEKIYTIRGKQVMLDKDLAQLYGVETKRLNEQVRRNMERFPEDFMFQLTMEECSRSQIATLNIKQGKNLKYLPYAFTENGIAMLSSVLRSEAAIAANIKIMRTFTGMRRTIARYDNLLDKIETIERGQWKMQEHLAENDKKFEIIFNKIDGNEISPRQGIFFDGQIYDAYVFVSDLVRTAVRRIVLIDNYIDDTVLTLLDKRTAGVQAAIYTGRLSRQLQLDMDKHDKQYSPIDVNMFSKAHDRFLIIDDDVYLIGASIKDIGKKWFGFTLMENTSADKLIALLQ